MVAVVLDLYSESLVVTPRLLVRDNVDEQTAGSAWGSEISGAVVPRGSNDARGQVGVWDAGGRGSRCHEQTDDYGNKHTG
jgi:hypothetical protein